MPCYTRQVQVSHWLYPPMTGRNIYNLCTVDIVETMTEKKYSITLDEQEIYVLWLALVAEVGRLSESKTTNAYRMLKAKRMAELQLKVQRLVPPHDMVDIRLKA